MLNDRNLLNGRLHFFRDLNNARQARIALNDAAEKLSKDLLDLSINQVVDLEFVEPVRFFELPGARSADNDLWFVLLDDGMGNDANELMRIDRHQVFTR
jgi:hypothetical protein